MNHPPVKISQRTEPFFTPAPSSASDMNGTRESGIFLYRADDILQLSARLQQFNRHKSPAALMPYNAGISATFGMNNATRSPLNTERRHERWTCAYQKPTARIPPIARSKPESSKPP